MCLSEDSRIEATIRKEDVLISAPLLKDASTTRNKGFHYSFATTPRVLTVAIGCALGLVTVIFSLVFPYVLTPTESKAIYQPAFWIYDPETSHFDNTIWTYGTDYVLMIVMSTLVALIGSTPGDDLLKRRAKGLLLCYAVSVAAGGLAHQFFLTLESRNTIAFRILWTLCVGTVTAAGGFMGACGSQLGRLTGGFYVPEWAWFGFGTFTTIVCMAGYMSFQRPACDIFIAGITQIVPTLYICLLAMLSRHRLLFRNLCVMGFSLNAPLLPMYAILIYHFGWSLPRINTLLHAWLCLSWTAQGLSLRHFAMTQHPPPGTNSNNSKTKAV